MSALLDKSKKMEVVIYYLEDRHRKHLGSLYMDSRIVADMLLGQLLGGRGQACTKLIGRLPTRLTTVLPCATFVQDELIMRRRIRRPEGVLLGGNERLICAK